MKRYTAIIASLLILAGCAQEITQELTPQTSESFDFTLEATLDSFDEGNLEDGATTKASATTVVRLSWNKGDEISVVNLTTGKALGGSLVADAAGTTTTFSGTLTGTVNNGDQVAFLYPSQGYTEEQTYQPVTVDFSRQGGQSKTDVPICVFAKTTASGPQFSGASTTFKFLMSYIQFSFAGLGASEEINEVTVDGMGSSMTLSLSADGFTAAPNVGTITMSPQSYSTTSTGTKAFYMSFAESPSVSKRNVTVWTDAGLKAGTFTGATLNANSSYTTIIANFKDAPVPFADENFKAYCVANFDTDGDGEISLAEAETVTRINCSGEDSRRIGNIASLDGIQYFTALTRLSCDFNQLTSLDVRNNTKLTYLSCTLNKISRLDISNNTALIDLHCANNQLTSLDVSSNINLKTIECDYNQLTGIDVSNNLELDYLGCMSNLLTKIDISKNTALSDLKCTSNQLKSLDVSNNAALYYIECQYNQLTSLDVSNNDALVYLECDNNQLTSLDVRNNAALQGLNCSNNQLTSLDVSGNLSMTSLDCSPMETLEELIMSEGQIINRINSDRNSKYIPDHTIIRYGSADQEEPAPGQNENVGYEKWK